MILADTNILFSFAVKNDWSVMARALFAKDADWRTESHALVEMTNVLVRYLRNGLMTDSEALQALDVAQRLLSRGVYIAGHEDALIAAREWNISAYDARFLVAARALGVRLTTEDAKLQRAAPILTQSLDWALASL